MIDLLSVDPTIDFSYMQSICLVKAAMNGHLPVVQKLLSTPGVDPSDCNTSYYIMQ